MNTSETVLEALLLKEVMQEIIDRSHDNSKGTSKVIDMRLLAERALAREFFVSWKGI